MERAAQGCGRLEDADKIRFVVLMLLEPRDRMLHHRQMVSVILGKFRRTHKRNFGAEAFPDVGDLLVVGGEDDAVEHARILRRLNGPGDEGLARELFDIFARAGFRPAARGDDAEDFHNLPASSASRGTRSYKL